MKNLWLHGMYWTVIGVLGFQLWTKTIAAQLVLGQLDKVMEISCAFFDGHLEYLYQDIEKETETNPLRFKTYFWKGKQSREASKLVANFIDSQLIKVQNHAKLDLNIIKDSLNFYSKSLTNIQDKEDSVSLVNRYEIIRIIQNDTFWKRFNNEEKAYLQVLKNQFKLDEILYLNYLQDKVTYRSCGITEMLRVAIAPKKASLIEGEKFEAQIYLSKSVSSNIDSNITFFANNQKLSMRDGISHFSLTEKTTGLKTLRVQAFLRNPATGETTTTTGEFQYHVLPKCSQNCE